MPSEADQSTGMPGPARPVTLALSVAALGVVFGDIGTSPLYTIATVFDPSDPHPVAATRQAVYGIISLVFWSVTIIVTVKYVLLVMRADNDGEGGILALITLIRRQGTPGGRRTKLALAARLADAAILYDSQDVTLGTHTAVALCKKDWTQELVQPLPAWARQVLWEHK